MWRSRGRQALYPANPPKIRQQYVVGLLASTQLRAISRSTTFEGAVQRGQVIRHGLLTKNPAQLAGVDKGSRSYHLLGVVGFPPDHCSPQKEPKKPRPPRRGFFFSGLGCMRLKSSQRALAQAALAQAIDLFCRINSITEPG